MPFLSLGPSCRLRVTNCSGSPNYEHQQILLRLWLFKYYLNNYSPFCSLFLCTLIIGPGLCQRNNLFQNNSISIKTVVPPILIAISEILGKGISDVSDKTMDKKLNLITQCKQVNSVLVGLRNCYISSHL